MTNDLLQGYEAGGLSDDEMVDQAGAFRSDYRELGENLRGWSLEEHLQREERADLALLSAGITFNVYSEEEGAERIFPFSLIPRIIGAKEWADVESGLKQRLRALNLFPIGRIRSAANHQRASDPGGDRPRRARLQPGDGELPTTVGGLCAHRRLRSGPRQAARDGGPGRQSQGLPRACPTCWKTEP